jgi:penicillin-binding protein
MENAIVYSDNIYFGYTAMKAGWERIDPFLENMGFGQTFPFDVRVSKSQIRSTGSTSNLQLLAATGFGQGEMLITPLQMASIFSVFANDGDVMKPRLVKEFNRMNGMSYETVSTVDPGILYQGILTQETLDIINPMLRKVITTGSGQEGRLLDIQTLGKTGTAEIGGNKEREIAWSISFVQNTDYERLVCVVLEVPTDPATAGKYRHTCIKEMLAP